MSGFQAGQVVVITGASSGFGAATARRFAAEGGRVILLARRRDRIEALAHEIGNGAEAHVLDVTNSDAVGEVFARLPVPDVLVNNAGLSKGVEPTDQVDLANFEAVIDTNLKGTFYTTRAALRGMRERGTGHIVNVGSVGWMVPFAGGNSYVAAKAAVHAFCQTLRAEVKETRIRVSEILPGMARTEFSDVRFNGDQAKVEAAYQGLDFLTADDIADAIYYCVSVPPRVNIDMMVLFPQQQHIGPAAVVRRP
jgi:3-hydroxy acid dehydrogenase/malonic semialdehyde reductase